MVRVLFLCLGNICRSPIAHGLFEHHVTTLGRGDQFFVESAGTSGYHEGDAPDPGSVRIMRSHGVDISGQRSQRLSVIDFERCDFIVAMDRSNRSNAERVATLPDGRLLLLRDFDPEVSGRPGNADVPDPWGGGADGFGEVYRIIERSMPQLLAHIDGIGPRRR